MRPVPLYVNPLTEIIHARRIRGLKQGDAGGRALRVDPLPDWTDTGTVLGFMVAGCNSELQYRGTVMVPEGRFSIIAERHLDQLV